MTRIAIFCLNIYQLFFSPDSGLWLSRRPTCRFFPSCSEYAKQAIVKYGFIRGAFLSVRRILKCRPGQIGGLDPLL